MAETKPSRAPVDPEARRRGQAVAALREARGLSQEQAASHHEDDITKQYWGQIETGRVPGIYRPATQRKLIDALNAARPDLPPLTIEDLAARLDDATREDAAARMNRVARELGSVERPQDPGIREAVFPTRDGPVLFRYPADLTPDGFKDLEAYFAVFLRTVAPA